MENAQHLGVPNLVRLLRGWTPFPMGVVLSLTMRCSLARQMCPQVQMREDTEYPEPTLEQREAVVDGLRASLETGARVAGLSVTLFARMGGRQVRAYSGGGERDLKREGALPSYVVHVDTFGNITPCRAFLVDSVTTKSGTFAQVWNSPRSC